MRRWLIISTVVSATLLGCPNRGPEETTPEGAFALLMSAMCPSSQGAYRSRSRAFELLAPETQAALTERAVEASRQAGRTIEPAQMLAVERCVPNWESRTVEVVINGDRATLTVAGPEEGETSRVEAVSVEGRWRIVMPLPD